MKKIRKYLYLLQLEEYDNARFLSWLNKNKIDQLIERKGKLKITIRTIFIFVLAFPILVITKTQSAISFSNQIISCLFSLLKKTIIFLAFLKINLYRPKHKIVITGSYGKTTLKEYLAWVLSSKYEVFKTPGNINIALGIAVRILKELKKSQSVMIVEAGAYKPGEIKEICHLIRPNIGIVTIFGWMHLERFKTFANIRKAKSEIVPYIKNLNKLYLPPSDHHFINFQKTIILIARSLNISQKHITQKIKSFKSPESRLKEIRIKSNITLLDDTYNSNPLGFQKALRKLSTYRNRQKIVITPGMIELGEKQDYFNKRLAKRSSQIADFLIIVGETNKKALCAGALKQKAKIRFIQSDQDPLEKVSKILRPPSVLLMENQLPDHYF